MSEESPECAGHSGACGESISCIQGGSPSELTRLMYSFIQHVFIEHLLCAQHGSEGWQHSSDQDEQNSHPRGADINGNNNGNKMEQKFIEAVPFLGSAHPKFSVVSFHKNNNASQTCLKIQTP